MRYNAMTNSLATMKSAKKKIVLFDSHAILHRAYHALPDFSSSKGEPTGALYGLATMLIKIIGELKPDYLAACYDMADKTFRHEAYEGYKAGRSKTEDDLVAQIVRSYAVYTAFNISIYEKSGFEADDILGTIVEKLKNDKNIEIVIASGDMDTLQLVDGTRVRVYTLKKGIKDTIIYDEESVRERFGFDQKLLPDYKGLRGDPSDNIIGVPGIGEKTATELIQKFGSIDDIYKKLKKNPSQFEKEGIKPRIVELLKTNEEEARFSRLLGEIRRDASIDFSIPATPWKDGLDAKKIEDLFRDLEFRTLAARTKEAFGMKDPTTGNLPFAATKVVSEEIDPKLLHETKVAVWLLNSNLTNTELEDILNYGKTEKFEVAREKILLDIEEKNLSNVYKEIELPLIPIVERMDARGVKIDIEYLKKLGAEYHASLSKLEKEIYNHAGEEFNINSPKQLGVILFDKMSLTAKNLKKTEGGARSTRESELLKMKDAHPIINTILDYRELQKLLSTYIDNIPGMVDGDSRLHSSFIQTGSTTGRMASQNPNLQNIPVQGDLGRRIRNAFVADKAHVLMAFDYSQIELRIAAILSGDEKLIDIFKKGEDVHTAVAAEVFKVSLKDVTKDMRRKAKVINFGILYGMGVNALKDNLKSDRKEAQEFYDKYFETFTTLAKFLEELKKETARRGYTETIFGRRRYFEGINSKIPYIRAAAERMALNAPIQGTQADITKKAMIAVDEYLKKAGLIEKAHLILQVHDELIYEVEEKIAKQIAEPIKKVMESVLPANQTKGVPIVANASVGPNWGELK